MDTIHWIDWQKGLLLNPFELQCGHGLLSTWCTKLSSYYLAILGQLARLFTSFKFPPALL